MLWLVKKNRKFYKIFESLLAISTPPLPPLSLNEIYIKFAKYLDRTKHSLVQPTLAILLVQRWKNNEN